MIRFILKPPINSNCLKNSFYIKRYYSFENKKKLNNYKNKSIINNNNNSNNNNYNYNSGINNYNNNSNNNNNNNKNNNNNLENNNNNNDNDNDKNQDENVNNNNNNLENNIEIERIKEAILKKYLVKGFSGSNDFSILDSKTSYQFSNLNELIQENRVNFGECLILFDKITLRDDIKFSNVYNNFFSLIIMKGLKEGSIQATFHFFQERIHLAQNFVFTEEFSFMMIEFYEFEKKHTSKYNNDDSININNNNNNIDSPLAYFNKPFRNTLDVLFKHHLVNERTLVLLFKIALSNGNLKLFDFLFNYYIKSAEILNKYLTSNEIAENGNQDFNNNNIYNNSYTINYINNINIKHFELSNVYLLALPNNLHVSLIQRMILNDEYDNVLKVLDIALKKGTPEIIECFQSILKICKYKKQDPTKYIDVLFRSEYREQLKNYYPTLLYFNQTTQNIEVFNHLFDYISNYKDSNIRHEIFSSMVLTSLYHSRYELALDWYYHTVYKCKFESTYSIHIFIFYSTYFKKIPFLQRFWSNKLESQMNSDEYFTKIKLKFDSFQPNISNNIIFSLLPINVFFKNQKPLHKIISPKPKVLPTSFSFKRNIKNDQQQQQQRQQQNEDEQDDEDRLEEEEEEEEEEEQEEEEEEQEREGLNNEGFEDFINNNTNYYNNNYYNNNYYKNKYFKNDYFKNKYYYDNKKEKPIKIDLAISRSKNIHSIKFNEELIFQKIILTSREPIKLETDRYLFFLCTCSTDLEFIRNYVVENYFKTNRILPNDLLTRIMHILKLDPFIYFKAIKDAPEYYRFLMFDAGVFNNLLVKNFDQVIEFMSVDNSYYISSPHFQKIIYRALINKYRDERSINLSNGMLRTMFKKGFDLDPIADSIGHFARYNNLQIPKEVFDHLFKKMKYQRITSFHIINLIRDQKFKEALDFLEGSPRDLIDTDTKKLYLEHVFPVLYPLSDLDNVTVWFDILRDNPDNKIRNKIGFFNFLLVDLAKHGQKDIIISLIEKDSRIMSNINQKTLFIILSQFDLQLPKRNQSKLIENSNKIISFFKASRVYEQYHEDVVNLVSKANEIVKDEEIMKFLSDSPISEFQPPKLKKDPISISQNSIDFIEKYYIDDEFK
ncbi:hypothetical protein DDB_G0291794 [Dictyostelium discoideum AX4]|uniref:Uncharacterized protein n=1 Tax=Dictyostelium discoideum TaxID=44689 RepID=Q54E56_DICDI|nr:hypothetical protein DDB_G0291794 [Dictyostelium discoideum AX4]EAL61518.1 hypothetical protein DDB_G0291794 [Dictyostelium discoideum AX4]|eukprot:XP_629931.1 hypothetical protein DDB_G0291794 [Dictyostelium discoideum AX4]